MTTPATVTCPRCNQPPGRPCTSNLTSKPMPRWHRARVLAAARALVEARTEAS